MLTVEEEKKSKQMSKINYYLKENEHTRPFFNPKLFIIPGVLFLWGILFAAGEIIRYSILFLLLEWLVMYLVIMYNNIQIVLENQEKILTNLDEKKKRRTF